MRISVQNSARKQKTLTGRRRRYGSVRMTVCSVITPLTASNITRRIEVLDYKI